MLGILPVAALALLIAVARTQTPTWRHALVAGAVAWGVLVTASTEILAAFDGLSKPWLAGFWAIAVVVLAVVAARLWDWSTITWSGLVVADTLLVAGMSAIVIATFIVGFVSAPNTYDSMTYHLGRVDHWLDNGNVDHYATSISRQIDQPPFAEYVVAHFQSLVEGDRLAFLVQWLALGGCCAIASLLAQQHGAGRTTQVLAAVLVASMPMAILQGSSTQNDLVASFWILALACVVVSIAHDQERRCRWRLCLGAGACIGLAVLTKGTAVVLVVPLGVWLVTSSFRRWGRGAFAPLAVAALVTVALNSAHLEREFSTFGAATSSETAQEVRLVDPSPASFASNFVRNAALAAGTPYARVNARVIVRPVERFHAALGLDVNDVRWTEASGDGFQFGLQSGKDARFEDYAGNPLQFLLLLAVLVAVAFVEHLRKKVGALALVVVSMYVLFCLPFRWQPWGSRLLLPMMVLAAPMVAITLGEVVRPRALRLVCTVVLAAAVPWAVSNRTRPLIGNGNVFSVSRTSSYFTYIPTLEPEYREAATVAVEDGCDALGIRQGWNDWEYPLRLLLARASDRPLRIEQVGVSGPSRKLRDPEFAPCAVIDIGLTAGPNREIDGRDYVVRWSRGPVQVLRPT
jgi:4-amino-4-deoxy-L-arabinose transferase-like glycosyltransferase